MIVEFRYSQEPGSDTSVVTGWLKNVGDVVSHGEPLIEVENNKVTVVVESPYTGTIVDVEAEVGDEITDGDVLAVFETKETS